MPLPNFLIQLLLSDRWDATKIMSKVPVTTPMLFLSGKQDTIVPQPQMIALRALRGQGRKEWREFDGTHNDTYLSPSYWSTIQMWLEREIVGSEKLEEVLEINGDIKVIP